MIAVDRTMFLDRTGLLTRTVRLPLLDRATSPSKTWYLPEGSSNWGFETWTLIENPTRLRTGETHLHDRDARGKDPLQDSPGLLPGDLQHASRHRGGGLLHPGVLRHTGRCREERCTRTTGERALLHRCHYTPRNDYFPAEGATGYNVGFTTYVLVQNPQSTPTDMTLTYQTQSGQVAGPSFTMQAQLAQDRTRERSISLPTPTSPPGAREPAYNRRTRHVLG